MENYITLLLFTEDLDEAETQYQLLAEKFPDNSNLKTISEKIAEEKEKKAQTEEIEPSQEDPDTSPDQQIKEETPPL